MSKRTTKAGRDDLEHLERVRNMCRAALALGLLASLAANIVAAEDTMVGRVVAGWPPLVLLIVVELIGRVSLDRGPLSWVRLTAAGGIAAVAALVSYKHMLDPAKLAGEGTVEAHLIPLTVDGLVIVASISLVGLNRRITAVAPKPKPRSVPAGSPRSATSSSSDPVPALAAVTSSSRGDVSERIAEYLVRHPEAKKNEIAEALGVSAKTVQRSAAWKQRMEMAG